VNRPDLDLHLAPVVAAALTRPAPSEAAALVPDPPRPRGLARPVPALDPNLLVATAPAAIDPNLDPDPDHQGVIAAVDAATTVVALRTVDDDRRLGLDLRTAGGAVTHPGTGTDAPAAGVCHVIEAVFAAGAAADPPRTAAVIPADLLNGAENLVR